MKPDSPHIWRVARLPGAVIGGEFKEDRQQVWAAGVDDFGAQPILFDRIHDCLAKQLGTRFVADGPTPSPDPRGFRRHA